MKKSWMKALLRKRIFIILLLLLQISVIIYTLISSSLTSAIISRVLTLLSIVVCLYIVSRRDKGAYKLTWVFMILLFPVFGGLFYLMFRIQSAARKNSRKSKRVSAKTQKLLALSGAAYQEACSIAPDHAPQIGYLQKFAGFPIYAQTATKYLTPGEKKFECLLEELKKAEKYIFLEYFIIQEGVMWNAILDILKEKVKQGVKVRLMYDDLGCFIMLPKDYRKQMERLGIECVVFNPFRPFLTTSQNNRDHRKIAVIDGKVAFTGGINLADEYIKIFPEHDVKHNNIIYDFQDKFIDIARLYYKRTGRELTFVPLYIAPKLKSMHLGKPIRFSADAPIDEERRRMCDYLMNEITDIARELPEHTVVPYRNIPKKDYPKNTQYEEKE